MNGRLRGARLAAVLMIAGCSADTQSGGGSSGNPRGPAAVVDGASYAPEIDPAAFVKAIDNPYMPLIPGTVRTYLGTSEEGQEREVFFVTYETKKILGVTTTVVHDKVYVRGVLHEDTFDWFAQDRDGNVWYFGEDSRDIEDGKIVSRSGSWEAGVDGAQPGIVMPADPQVADLYRQEFLEGTAEDTAEVLRLDETVSVPHGDFEDVLVTEDRNPLEPGLVENKYYARGIGVVKEQMVQGGEESLALIRVSKVDPPEFGSIQEAVDFLQTKVDVPVVVPSKLPRGAHLALDPVHISDFEGRRGASLRLDFGVEGYVYLAYGLAIFDGCGGDSAVPVDILGQPGLINFGHVGGHPYADVIWPVAEGTAEGRYGVDATLRKQRVIAMAESMEEARVEASQEEPLGC